MSDWTVYYVVIKKRRRYFVLHLWLGLVFSLMVCTKCTACAHLKRQRLQKRRRRSDRLITLDMLWLIFFLSVYSAILLSLFIFRCCMLLLLLPLWLHSIKNRWYDEEQIEEKIKEMTALGHLMNLCLPLKYMHALKPAVLPIDRHRRLFDY